MPAPKRLYMDSREIAAITGVSLRQAQEWMRKFEQDGHTIRNGRSRLVLVDAFAAYLTQGAENDHLKRKHEIQSALQEYDVARRRAQ